MTGRPHEFARARMLGLQPIPWTLQRYIFREMGKTFLLTSVAMTAIFGLGGGVLRMVQMGDVTTGQFLRLIGLVLPLSVVMTLPVASLFSAASTYGRLSADNEFVACRSSGINMHVLFVPTLVLSLFSAGVTFACINYVIPGMVRNLSEFIASDFSALVQHQLNQPGGVALGPGRRCHADRAVVDGENPDRVILEGVAYLEATERDWLRFGTAQTVVLEIDRSRETPLVAGSMFDVTYFDRAKGQFAELGEQPLFLRELSDLNNRRLKFLELEDLFYYRRHPDEWHRVEEELVALRLHIGARRMLDIITEQWISTGRRITLSDDTTSLTISSDAATRYGDGSGLQLTDVVIVERRAGRERTCQASRADIELARAGTLDKSGIQIAAYDVRISAGDQVVQRQKELFGPVSFPQDLIEDVKSMPTDQMLRRDPDIGDAHPIEKRRRQAAAVRAITQRRIDAIINQRLAYSASTFVLVILAAALGIVFRGAHAIISFGVSFVPALVVLITIIMGRQMTQNENTYLAGLTVMWGGMGLVALMDVWMLTRVIRR